MSIGTQSATAKSTTSVDRYLDALSAFPDVTNLSPEMILGIAKNRLDDLTGKIKALLDDQKQMGQIQNVLNELKRALAGSGAIDVNNADRKREVLNAYLKAINALPDGPQKTAVLAELDQFRTSACLNDKTIAPKDATKSYSAAQIEADVALGDDGGKNNVSADEMAHRADAIDGIFQDMSRDAQLKMMSLQEYVGQRTETVTLFSNLIQKLNETAMVTANNIGK